MALVGIDDTKLKAAVAEIGSDRALASAADVTDEEPVIEAGYCRFGDFNILFSNAGISGAISKLVDYPSDDLHRTLAVHIGGAFHVLKHGPPRLRDGGSVIITSSVVGLMGFGDLCGYIAAKRGQVGLMRAAAKKERSAAPSLVISELHSPPGDTGHQSRCPCVGVDDGSRPWGTTPDRRRSRDGGAGCSSPPRRGRGHHLAWRRYLGLQAENLMLVSLPRTASRSPWAGLGVKAGPGQQAISATSSADRRCSPTTAMRSKPARRTVAK